MDAQEATLWAAGIGMAGVVLTAGMGWRSSRISAKAQVDAALAGVRELADQEQKVAVSTARRAAHHEFLGQIEAACMALDRALHVSREASGAQDYHQTTHLPPPPGPEWVAAKARLEDSVDALWFRPSALRLYADAETVDKAESLMRLARSAADAFYEVEDAINQDYPRDHHYELIEGKLNALKAGISEWAAVASISLGHPSG
ncbi:hypothetical protein AB0H47_35490 [Streptomyces globisporus]|uniref:hypothetical protein n=1 Tax=Streptomyces globisporus TaxID=1908 RepID=UPI00346152AA